MLLKQVLYAVLDKENNICSGDVLQECKWTHGAVLSTLHVFPVV